MATTQLLTFAAVAAILIAVPGPSVLFIVGRGLALGRAAALRAVAGNAAGEFAQVLAVAVGIGAAVQRSPIAFTGLRLAGAAFLVGLGVRTIRRRHVLGDTLRTGSGAPGSAPGVLRGGVVVGLTNPKTLAFFALVLPQFVDRGAGHVQLQLLLLGLVWVGIALVSDSCWGVLAGTVRGWLARSPRRTAALGGASGLVMIGLGVGLGVSARGG